MKKIVFLLFFLIVYLHAENITINFIETKYIEALDEKVSKNGSITFLKNEAIINYYGLNWRKITLNNETITMETKNEKIVKTKREEPAISMMFIMFKALYENDQETIKKYFTISEKYKDEITLISKSYSSPILEIVYQTKDNKIAKLEIIGKDNSRIFIEVDNKK